jgi:hypothetical protein
MKEANIQAQIMLALSNAGCIVWRNNTGALTDKTGRLVRYGLCKGSSDIIGVCPDGRFLAVEVKSGRNRLTPEQERFISAVKASGGRAGVARSVDDAIGILEG